MRQTTRPDLSIENMTKLYTMARGAWVEAITSGPNPSATYGAGEEKFIGRFMSEKLTAETTADTCRDQTGC